MTFGVNVFPLSTKLLIVSQTQLFYCFRLKCSKRLGSCLSGFCPLVVIHQASAFWFDFSRLSPYLHFLFLITIPLDWCYDTGNPPSWRWPTQVFDTCHPFRKGEKWRKFWIYKTSLILFLWWHNFHYTTRGNRTLLRERWKYNIFVPIIIMRSLRCSTEKTY